jgi:multiple antibiotic resistance protein
MAYAEKFLQAFIPLFVAIDPIGLAAIFLGLGQGIAPEQRQRIARQATVTGGAVALLFLFLGASIFSAIGISEGDFRIAGGAILFILAARELIHPASAPEKLPQDFGVVPLGMPLIAGPALIATLILQAQTVGVTIALAALNHQPAARGARVRLQRKTRPPHRRDRHARDLEDHLDAPRRDRRQPDPAGVEVVRRLQDRRPTNRKTSTPRTS